MGSVQDPGRPDGGGRSSRPPVLLLEDEPIQAMLLAELIEEASCEPVEVRTAEAAIEILECHTDIRVVVADLDVRGSIMGLKLAATIRDRQPPIELVLTGSMRPRMDRIPARGVFCDKPFERTGLVGTLREFKRS